MASGRRIFPSFFRDLNGPGVHMSVCVCIKLKSTKMYLALVMQSTKKISVKVEFQTENLNQKLDSKDRYSHSPFRV